MEITITCTPKELADTVKQLQHQPTCEVVPVIPNDADIDDTRDRIMNALGYREKPQ